MITTYSGSPIKLPLEDRELLKIIREYVLNLEQGSFSYLQLCDYLVKKSSVNVSDGQQGHVVYLVKRLSPSDYSRISRLLWQLLWEKVICIDFYENPYQPKRNDDTVFLICNQNEI